MDPRASSHVHGVIILTCLFKPCMFPAHPGPHNVLYIYRHTFKQSGAHQPHISVFLLSLSTPPPWVRFEALSKKNTPSKPPLANRLYWLIFSPDKRLGTRRRAQKQGGETLRRETQDYGDENPLFAPIAAELWICPLLLLARWYTLVTSLLFTLPQHRVGGILHWTMGPSSRHVTQRSILTLLTAPGWLLLHLALASK